jgi:hypothetical protein
VTAPLIAPLIPPRTRPGGREYGRPGTARRLPVATAPEVPAVPDDVVYGFGRMDASGRVADRAMTIALGWQPGDRLTLTAAAGVVIVRCGPGGRGWVRRSTATSCRSTSSSASLDAAERPSRTSQPQSRTKIR